MFQDIFQALFSASTAREPGTLYHAKNMFSHRNVKKDVKQCFNHAVELLDVMTDGYVLGVALDHMGVEDLTDEPQDLPTDPDQLAAYKMDVVEAVTEMAFHPPRLDAVWLQ